MRFGKPFLRFWVDFTSRNPPKMVPKLVRNRVLEGTWCCITFVHDFYMFVAFFLLIFWMLFCSGFWRFFPIFCISRKLRKSILAWRHRGFYALAGFRHENVFPSGLRKSVKIATIFTYKIYRKSNSKNTWKFHRISWRKHEKSPPEPPKTSFVNRSACRTAFLAIFSDFHYFGASQGTPKWSKIQEDARHGRHFFRFFPSLCLECVLEGLLDDKRHPESPKIPPKTTLKPQKIDPKGEKIVKKTQDGLRCVKKSKKAPQERDKSEKSAQDPPHKSTDLSA